MAALGTQRFSGPTVPVQKGHLIRDVALAGLGPSGPGRAAGYSSRTNVLIRGGVIERVGDLRLFGPVIGDADAVLEVDGRDLVALPALVEPHAHLDKALTVGAFSNGERDLAAAIEAWGQPGPQCGHPTLPAERKRRRCAT
jgi:cytosine/adenosine deaminase-related metal-dependent hydrolase